MKYTMILAVVAGLGMAGASFAADTPATAAATATAATAKPAKAAATGPKATADDIKKLCDYRFHTNAKKMEACVKKNEASVGKPLSKKNQKAIELASKGEYKKPKAKGAKKAK